MKNSQGIFIGIAAAAAGVILGMLIAPKKGENLRKDIKDTAGDWTKKLDHLLTDGKEEFKKAKKSLASGEDSMEAKVTGNGNKEKY